MPIYRCNRCGNVAEASAHSSGEKIPCGQCQSIVTVFDTSFYVRKLSERYAVLCRELEAIKAQEAEVEQHAANSVPSSAAAIFADEIRNTTALATEVQHQPLKDWFVARQAQPQFDYSQVDTTGFFDESALLIGSHYEQLSNLLGQLRYAYRKEWSWLNMDMSGQTPQEVRATNDLVRQLYSYTFFARHSYQKQKQTLGVALQQATSIRRFFDGGWLEWWAFMRLLETCLERKIEFSCARGACLQFQNEEQRELDVVFLLKKRFPIIVECKSGEFRADIDKYVRLRRRLAMDRTQFIICSPDLNEAQAAGLSAMYELTFLNLQSFTTHLNALLA